MATLVELKGNGLAVGIPTGRRYIVLMGKELRRWLNNTPSGHFNDDWYTIVQRVAGFGVFLFVKEGLDEVLNTFTSLCPVRLGLD
jgi:hypothetical protein